MFNHTFYLRLIFQVSLIIFTLNLGQVWASAEHRQSGSSQRQPPIFNDGGSRLSDFNYKE
ncbi:hypothetical protein VB834_06410 [Limnoraphis robusta Tam1]|uniref:Uncharacterized protein n=1 Tax=Limnoraphis robusta CCNP1315 TaxID=3110306 RepID=A0ABU5TXC6_9CYAN|nr:hypothetical protein [Limnoraphis robusta]MEA5499813.1 hypothetical protein [Limnoraphis robusta BA-68 BA1]MEA5518608.1 hypothetical protein [Limnoraphis robusta CCNP1315]MEA5538662.1 hypothetical protein [Limnoraphis robusta Tam1]MEA5547997.1 hypothetical protein [Limnoraphis robusta CCNP1324]